MANNTAQNFEQVFLTYKDVHDANPSWGDRMVEDYLSIKRDLVFTADSADLDKDRLDALEVRVAALEALIPVSVYTLVDYTSLSNEVITCANALPITITLMAAPVDQQMVNIKRTGGKVTIFGNGNDIDGDTSVVLNLQYVGLDLVYSLAGGFWSIV